MKLRNLLPCTVLLFALPLAAATFTTNGPRTTNNDDSCDISLLPAATLLIPYFEVDVTSPAGNGQTTIFSVTNTTNLPQAAAVTLWTDRGYPVITFRMYLTGYDVQSINLYDIIRRGQIAPDEGTGSDVSPVGELSGNPATDVDTDNPRLDEASCVNMPVLLPFILVDRMTRAFTQGVIPAIGGAPACEGAGGVHQNAVGYITIDLVNTCAATLPTQASYFSAELGYDNVLMGDYLQVDGANDFAQGSPAVHIRAVPEGGTPSTRTPNNFTRTFYSHLQPSASRTLDNRQPLPATFGARWIEGGATGFETHFKIWREVETPASAACSAYAGNADMAVQEIVRFDEEENPETLATPANQQKIPAAALISVSQDEIIPRNTTDAVAGWIYFNLHNGRDAAVASQNWIVSSMRAENRFSVDSDAVALGNGCSPVAGRSNASTSSGQPIGPSPNTTP
jgi:hypothetical protein